MADLDNADTSAALAGSCVRIAAGTDESGRAVLGVFGDVDLSSVGALRAAIDRALAAQPTGLVFDLAGLTFMDSSGIALLLAAAERVDTIELRQPTTMVRRVIELSGLTSTLPMTP